jgi:hypothetical protein
LPRLRNLNLSHTRVSGTGLEHLHHLDILFLDHTHVSDAGLACLKGMKELGLLSLAARDGAQRDWTRGVTVIGLATRAAHPRCARWDAGPALTTTAIASPTIKMTDLKWALWDHLDSAPGPPYRRPQT